MSTEVNVNDDELMGKVAATVVESNVDASKVSGVDAPKITAERDKPHESITQKTEKKKKIIFIVAGVAGFLVFVAIVIIVISILNQPEPEKFIPSEGATFSEGASDQSLTDDSDLFVTSNLSEGSNEQAKLDSALPAETKVVDNPLSKPLDGAINSELGVPTDAQNLIASSTLITEVEPKPIEMGVVTSGELKLIKSELEILKTKLTQSEEKSGALIKQQSDQIEKLTEETKKNDLLLQGISRSVRALENGSKNKKSSYQEQEVTRSVVSQPQPETRQNLQYIPKTGEVFTNTKEQSHAKNKFASQIMWSSFVEDYGIAQIEGEVDITILQPGVMVPGWGLIKKITADGCIAFSDGSMYAPTNGVCN